MSDQQLQQKLTAIFYADIASYSKMMGSDEHGTHVRSMEILDLASDTIKHHSGNVLRYAGDAILAEFASVVSATKAATKIQREIYIRNNSHALDKQVNLRIGVNLGEVFEDRGEIFGDDVNLAARLESDAPPGGICISAPVYNIVHSKLDEDWRKGGEKNYKNISRTISVYYWTPFTTDKLPSQPNPPNRIRGKNRKPTIFINDGKRLDNKENTQELFESVGESIKANLSNISGISVVRTTDEADYLADFSVQTSATQFRITVSLYDSAKDEQFWSERFTDRFEDIFSALDKVSVQITMALRYEIYEREGARLKNIPLEDKSVEEIMGEVGPHLYRPYHSDFLRAEQLLDHALSHAEKGFMLFSLRALAAMREDLCGYKSITNKDGEIAEKYIGEALAQNNRHNFVMHVKAVISYAWHQDLNAALRSAEIGLEINPSLTICGQMLSIVNLLQGKTDLAFKYIEADLGNYSRYSGSYWSLEYGALAHFVNENYQQAAEWAMRANELYSGVPKTILLRMAAYHHLGDTSRATLALNDLLKFHPSITLEEIKPYPFESLEHWLRLVEAWRAVGIPSSDAD